MATLPNVNKRLTDPLLRDLGRAVAEAQDEALEHRTRPHVDTRVAALRAARAERLAEQVDPSLRRPAAIGMALGAVASLAFLWPRGGALEFAVGTDARVAGAFVAAPLDRPVPIGFSDGSNVVVGAGGRARVASVTEHGARLVLEGGTIRVDVVPRAGNDWSVVGGPFEIRVTGTSFDATWDVAREALTVTMHEGHVVVRGGCLVQERALGRGESASIACPHPTTSAGQRADATEPPPASESHAPPPSRSAHPPSSAEPAQESTSWRELARQSAYKAALAAAEQEGFGGLCDTLGPSDLLELGAVGRLGGGAPRAVEAYQAARRRFPGTDSAATAAFHLGQLAFDGAHAYGDARRWFTLYLAERPAGALAAEALGRSMEAEERLGDLVAARTTAARYVATYPTGAHAPLARSLLDSSGGGR